MAINLSQIKDLLLPGLRGLTGKYEQIPRQWDKVFTKFESNMALERTAEMRYLPLPFLKTEGGQIKFDNNSGERYIFNQEHLEIAIGFAITRKAIDDNLYKTQFAPSNLGMMESYSQAQEIYAANVFNQGTTYNPSVGGDGVAYFSTAHPIDGGTYANTPMTQIGLNESSLLSTNINIRTQFKDQAGLRMFSRGRKLLVPPALEPTAVRLIKTELRPGTADNDVNAILSVAGGLPEGYMVMDFLTSNFAWFVLTNVAGLAMMNRKPYETDMQVDFITQNLLVTCYGRYSFNYFNPRSAYGNFPTS
jgi:hypothetical protein